MTRSKVQDEIFDAPDDRNHHLAIVKWDDHQAPNTTAWCKLHRKILMSKTWQMASEYDRSQMIVLMVLAMQYDNRIPYDEKYIQSVGSLTCEADDDGINLEYLLRCKFIELRDGPDGHIDPADEIVKPRKKRSKKLDESKLQRFDDFWKAYPKKDAKIKARGYWVSQNLDEHADQIIAAVLVQAKSEQWTKDNGEYIPLPSTYLNNQRWLDEGTTVGRQSGELPQNAPGARGY